MAALALPDFHVTGPVHQFVRTPGTGGAALYLGTSEVTPKVDVKPMVGDVFNDIGGRAIPMQKTDQGEMAVVGTLLNRYSQGTMNTILARGAKIKKGQRTRGSKGSLLFGVADFELWLVFENAMPFAPGAGNRVNGLELGYYFPRAIIGGQTDDALGTDVRKALMVFECYEYMLPQASATAVQGNERSWLLYSTVDADFPADVRVPQ